MVEKIGYSVDETMQATGLGRTVVYGLIASGELESVKVGRRRIIPADAVRAYFDAKRTEQAEHDGPVAV